MEKEVKILGYYHRERDGNEYIHYSESGEEYLTTGVTKWNLKNRQDRMEQLTRVEKIDINKMLKRLREFSRYSKLTVALQDKECSTTPTKAKKHSKSR